MAKDSEFSRVQLMAKLAESGTPFNPLGGMEISGANVDRLQKSMKSFGWHDPRFVTKEQAANNGWSVNPGVARVLVSTRNVKTGNFDTVSLHNAESVHGMPSLAAMLTMSDSEVSKMSVGSLNSHGRAFGAVGAIAEVAPVVEALPVLHGVDSLGVKAGQGALFEVDSEDELSIGPASGVGLSLEAQAEFSALSERFNRNEKISTDANFLAIEDTNYGLMAVPNDALDLDLAANLVMKDVAALKSIANRNERFFAAAIMGASANSQVHYRNELGLQAPEVYVEASAAVEKFLASQGAAVEKSVSVGGDVPMVDSKPGLDGADLSSPGVKSAPEAEAGAGQFAVMAAYWKNGLHNSEGVALAVEINKLIRDKKLTEDKEAISRLLSLYPKAKELVVGVVPLSRLLNDQDLKKNLAEPKTLLGGELIRDKDGAYRPVGLGASALLADKGDAIVLKSKGAEAYRGAMELALAKGWKSIELKGKPTVLADAWLEAKLMDLEVVNYLPTEKDQARFAARVAQECERKNQGQTRTNEQAPEMVEVRPFVDADGLSKMATVTYTVSFQGGVDASFGNAKDAAKAFGDLSPAASPVVIRSVTRADGVVQSAVVAGVDIRTGTGAGAKTQERMEDRVFDEALSEVIEGVNAIEALKLKVVSTGDHVGLVMDIKGSLVGMKSGRDPNVLVWHDMSKVTGGIPKRGDVAEISYAKGLGILKSKLQAKELNGDDSGLGR